MIKMWLQWIILFCFWALTTLSIVLWPSVEDINQELIDNEIGQEINIQFTEDIISILLYKPFHFLLSILLLIFAMLGAASVVRKVIYESRIAYMFKRFPYEPSAMLFILVIIYLKTFNAFPITTIILTATVCIFEIYFYLAQKKSEVYYVREDLS